MRIALRLIMLMLAMPPITACGWSGAAVKGRVLEEGTNKPIQGVNVIARWVGRASMMVDSEHVCIHVGSAITDSEGRYEIQSWHKPSSINFVSDIERTVLTIYKRGFGGPKIPYRVKKDLIYLAPFTGAREERLRYLKAIVTGSGCDEAGRSERNLYPLYKALYDEAKSDEGAEKDLKWFREMAAMVAVAEEGHMTEDEADKRMRAFLQDNLK